MDLPCIQNLKNMKTIKYILIAIFIGTIIYTVSPLTKKENKKNQIILECPQGYVSSKDLSESAEIIEARLTIFGLENFTVKASKNCPQVKIEFEDKIDVSHIKPLLLARGDIEFYRAMSRNAVSKFISTDDKLFSQMRILPLNYTENSKSSGAVMGFCYDPNVVYVNGYLDFKSFGQQELIRHCWGMSVSSKKERALYFLQSDIFNKSLISRDYIQNAEIYTNEGSDFAGLDLVFNAQGSKLWEEITMANLNRHIAIVIDGLVYSAPLLKTEISKGKCSIRGNYTHDQANILVAVINNPKLPLHFKVLEQTLICQTNKL